MHKNAETVCLKIDAEDGWAGGDGMLRGKNQ